MTASLDRFDSRKLNIGCGFDIREGFINVDLQDFHKPDIVASVLDLSVFPDCWAEQIVASDLLEHIGRKFTLAALSEWNRVLRVGGKLWLRTSYLPGLLQRMRHDTFGSLQSHKQLINDAYSTQSYEGDYHLTSFTEKLMRFYIWAAGFKMDELAVHDEWLFVVTATKVRDLSFCHASKVIESDAEFVRHLYLEILQREPDDVGLVGKLELIERGASRLDILRGIIGSSEREDLMFAQAPDFQLIYDQA